MTSSNEPEALQKGLLIANHGSALIVEGLSGRIFRCTMRQNLGILVCGDRVIWQPCGSREGVVVAVEQRRSLLTRPDFNGRPKPMAANLDQGFVVIAPRPVFNEFLIDRYLVALSAIGLESVLVMNKVDLLGTADLTDSKARLRVYQRIGYRLLLVSTRSAQGLSELRNRLQGRTSILLGQSGVGKSSLTKALLPDREIRIRALSDATGRGTHTTTSAMLYHLPDGGDLIDSPGVRSFNPGVMSATDLDQGFVELRPYLGSCRFSDCSHSIEPGCALLAAVAGGEIDARRLQSYRQLRHSL